MDWAGDLAESSGVTRKCPYEEPGWPTGTDIKCGEYVLLSFTFMVQLRQIRDDKCPRSKGCTRSTFEPLFFTFVTLAHNPIQVYLTPI